jgi:hypothetical protein
VSAFLLQNDVYGVHFHTYYLALVVSFLSQARVSLTLLVTSSENTYGMCHVESATLRENVRSVDSQRHNQIYRHPKPNGYGDNDDRKMWSSCGSTYCTYLTWGLILHCASPSLSRQPSQAIRRRVHAHKVLGTHRAMFTVLIVVLLLQFFWQMTQTLSLCQFLIRCWVPKLQELQIRPCLPTHKQHFSFLRLNASLLRKRLCLVIWM